MPAFQVPMMHHEFLVHYAQTADFELAQLMYKDNEVSMVVILPRKKDGLPEVEKNLSARTFAQALAQAREAELDVALPKFKMIEEFSLPEDLDRLGMHDAFIRGVANFTGMTQSVPLYISAVVHKAFVEVDEKGTEAAAATGVEIKVQSQTLFPVFRADHPFLFVLRHNATGSILFMGRVIDPRGK